MSAIRHTQGRYEVANAPPCRRSEVGWIVVLSFLFFVPAHAQSVATLRGTVVDPANAALPSARIMVRNCETGEERVTQTDNQGSYLVAVLPVGIYRVEIRAPSFQTQVMEGLNIEVARTVVQDFFQLQVDDISQELTVTSHANLIERASISCRGLAPGWTVGLVFWLLIEDEHENDLRSQS